MLLRQDVVAEASSATRSKMPLAPTVLDHR